ncbi:SH3 domain-containing protein [Streptomyces nitrosporeus]|uniref:SH3 domain-containing protein n=1 Tax=Streptomyces nitrosporeus TaxID=28894 RepID=UPI003320171F
MGVEDSTVVTGPAVAAEAAVATDGTVAAGEEIAVLAADVITYPIAPGYRVNVRRGPGTQYGIIRTLPYGMSVPVFCQKAGERVTGPYGTSNIWDNIGRSEYVSDTYVRTGSDGYIAPRCG